MNNIEKTGPDRVYFVRMNGLVKIGYSGSIKQRISQLKQETPYPIDLLRHVPGDRFTEQYFHFLFHHLRVKGEWFEAASELLSFIEGLNADDMAAPSDFIEDAHQRATKAWYWVLELRPGEDPSEIRWHTPQSDQRRGG